MKRLSWILCLGALFGTLCFAQSSRTDPRSARLDEVARSYTPGNAFMGAVLVVDGDSVLLDKGYGQADAEWNIPDAPDVKFRLGSLTKQFTATLVLLLQQDGKLNIADPVSKYLPDTPKSWEKITLANLLGHTSGIPNFTSDKDFGTWRMSSHTTAEELVFFRDKPLEFDPGSKFEYSNSNYEVLGAVIEKVSGKSYKEMLQERIFDPLGMKDTGLDSDELILPKRAQGYLDEQDGVHVVDHGGGIEGFNTSLMYVPERRIAIVVLSNVNGGAPESMSHKLLDVVLGKPVTLASERKVMLISQAELERFAGVYQLAPSFSLTIAVTKDGLTGQGTGQPSLPLFYEGIKDGHPLFFFRMVDAEIEFVPDASGKIDSLILHQAGHNVPGKRQ